MTRRHAILAVPCICLGAATLTFMTPTGKEFFLGEHRVNGAAQAGPSAAASAPVKPAPQAQKQAMAQAGNVSLALATKLAHVSTADLTAAQDNPGKAPTACDTDQAPSTSADPFLPVPPASFLDYHVSTGRALSEQVAQDVVVRARLARHFHMTEEDVVAYVRDNLVEGRLSAAQAGRYKIACIAPSGQEYYITERLPAGTPVFLLAGTDKPVLRLACGNPLVSSLPMILAKNKPRIKHDEAAMVASQTSIPGPVLVSDPKAPTVLALAPTSFTSDPSFAGEDFSSLGPMVSVGGFEQVLTQGAARGLGFIPATIGAVSVIALAGSHGGSKDPPNISEAPEPNAGIVIGIGMAMLVGFGLFAARRRSAPPVA